MYPTRYESFCALLCRVCVRYLFHDTWNILDVMTVAVIHVAFVSRMLGLGGHWPPARDELPGDADYSTEMSRQAFSLSKYALAAVAPMLLARLLFLSQIDPTLGPMVQVGTDSRSRWGELLSSGIQAMSWSPPKRV